MLRRGLYAITPSGRPTADLLSWADGVLAGGAVLLQYRDEAGTSDEVARDLLARCRARAVPLIINDDVELAHSVGAAGVHLGADDLPVASAREILGDAALIGASCYGDLDRARAALAAGADYLAFGTFRPSRTAPHKPVQPMGLLGEARALGAPVVAIGGITLEDAAELIAAGADLLAVIGDLARAEDPRARAAAFAALFL